MHYRSRNIWYASRDKSLSGTLKSFNRQIIHNFDVLHE